MPSTPNGKFDQVPSYELDNTLRELARRIEQGHVQFAGLMRNTHDGSIAIAYAPNLQGLIEALSEAALVDTALVLAQEDEEPPQLAAFDPGRN